MEISLAKLGCKTFSSQLSHQCLAKGKVSVLDNKEISQGTWFQKCKVCSHNLSQLQDYFEVIQTYRRVTRTVWKLLYNLYPDLPFFTFCQLCTLSSLHIFVYIYIHTYCFLWTKLADTMLLHSYFLQLILPKDKGILLTQKVKVKSEVAQSCPTLCDPMYYSLPGKSTGVGCHFLLQGIFPTQGSNPGLPHSRQTL